MTKIYVHHLYTDTLFLKLAHNTINREIATNGDVTTVRCQYNDTQFEFVFDKRVNDNSDGWHLIDFFAAVYQKDKDSKFYWEGNEEDLEILKKMNKVLEGKKNWIVTCFRTEKLFAKYDKHQYETNTIKIETEIEKMRRNKIVTDNYFMDSTIKNKYLNVYFTLSNTIFQWNEMMSIRWYYEFSKVFKHLNFEYDLMYSVRFHRLNRINILSELKKLNNPKIFLQRTAAYGIKKQYKRQNLFSSELVKNIPINSIYGENDFGDLTKINWYENIGYDLFFRVLPKAKMQILCETWSFCKDNFVSYYLSEKTYGLILSGIPFLSTHSYPLEMIEKILNVSPHPFYMETKLLKTEKDFASFVKKFMEDFDSNYKLCKDWVGICHQKLISHIETKNDLLELVINRFEKEKIIISKNII